MRAQLKPGRAVLGTLSLALLAGFLSASGALSNRPAALRLDARAGEAPATAGAAVTPAEQVPDAAKQQVLKGQASRPLAFEKNLGQSDDRALYTARGNGYGLALAKDRMVLGLMAPPPAKDQTAGETPAVKEGFVEISFAGANPKAEIAPVEKLPGYSNYFIGNDRSKWRTQVPNYAKVRYDELFPGIDLVCYGKQKELEYDFVVSPGADPDAIKLDVAGAESVRVDPNGDLVLAVNGGEVRQPKPVVYQEVDGVRENVDGRFVVEPLNEDKATHRVRFALAEFDHSRELVIDPSVYWGAWIGGVSGTNHTDTARSIAIDDLGNAYISGYTKSNVFPQTDMDGGTTGIQTFRNPSAYGGGTYDAFVAKLSADGSTNLYSTYVGGNGFEYGYAVAVDSSYNIYVGGVTSSTNLPTTATGVANSITSSKHAGNDGFVTKIAAAGTSLVYSVYVGSAGDDAVHDLVVNAGGNVFLAGRSDSSTNWPFGSAQTNKQAGFDAFAGKLNLAGNNWDWWTWMGGGNVDNAFGVAIDASENTYVVGQTTSSTASWQPRNPAVAGNVLHGSVDAFVVKINAGGGSFGLGYFIGGSSADYGRAVAATSDGSKIWVVGQTFASDFMAVEPQLSSPKIDSGYTGNGDGFIVRFDAGTRTMDSATFAGGTLGEDLFDCAVTPAGQLWTVGSTASNTPSSIPVTTNAPQTTFQGGGTDGFINVVEPSGTAFLMQGYLGGTGNDIAYGIALGEVFGDTAAYVCGDVTSETNFPFTDGAYKQTSPFGGHEAFAVLITRNTRPTAVAGNDQAITCSAASNPVNLDGSASFDPDAGDSIASYAWFLLPDTTTPVATTAMTTQNVGFGTHTFRLRVTDTFGATGTDDVVVTVSDTTAPSIPVLSSVELGTDSDACETDYVPTVPTATDACDPSPTVTGVRRDPSNNVQPLNGTYVHGTHTITWTATDDAGNSSYTTQQVTVIDDDAPVFDPLLPTLVTGTATDSGTAGVFIDYPDPGTQVTDNCAFEAVEGYVDNAFSPDVPITADGIYNFPAGRTLITWLAVDESINFEVYFTEVWVDAKSEFSASDDGWTIEGTATGPTHVGAGGNPDGFIQGTDTLANGTPWYFVAPSKYYSTILNPYATGISFDLRQNTGTALDSTEDVILVGNGITLTYNIGQPGTGWTSFNVPLDTHVGWTNKTAGAAATAADLTSVLESVTALKIRGKYNSADTTTGDLDNFLMTLQ